MASSEALRRSDKVTRGTLVLIAALLSAFALKYSSTVTAPLAFAFFAALVLAPVRRWVAHRVPRRVRWLGVVAAVVLLLLALAAIGGAVALAISQASEELPKHEGRLRSALEPVLSRAKESAGQGGTVVLKSASGAIEFLVVSVFFVVLMLSEVGQWREKLLTVLNREGAARVLDAAAATASGLRRYLLAITVVGLATAVLEGGFLLIMGVKLALVWALLFFILNYVPYVGSLIAAIPPVLFALATQGLQRGLLVALGIIVIEQIMGNLVAPLVEGRGTKLSPLIVLFAVTFWGWAWGAAGALLAVPMAVALMMLCARTPGLESVAVLLGEDARSHP